MVSQTIYTIDDVRQIAETQGFKLLSDEYKNLDTRVLLEDKDGYRYNIKFETLKSNSNRRSKFSPHNEFSLFNIQRFLDLHSDGTILLSDEFITYNSKYTFKCSCGNIFVKRLSDLISRKCCCQKCSRKNINVLDIDYYGEIKHKCDSMGYTLISTSITRAGDRFEYICNKHKEKGVQGSNYERFIKQGKICVHCARENYGLTRRVSIETATQQAEERGFEFVSMDYSTNNTMINVICKKHRDKGVQHLYYGGFLKQKMCGYCRGLHRSKEDFKSLLLEKGKDFEVIEYTQFKDKCLVRCKQCGYSWWSDCFLLTKSVGCPKCSASSYERNAIDILNELNIDYEYQYIFEDCCDIRPLIYDFYLPQYGVAIEIDGEGHDKPIDFDGNGEEYALQQFIKQKKHDAMKDEYCIKNNIAMIRVPSYILKGGILTTKKYMIEKLHDFIN